MTLYCDMPVRGDAPPWITGSNVGKAVGRLFTPPGQGAVEAAATAAQNKPAGNPRPDLGNGSVYDVTGGIQATNVDGYSPWLTAKEVLAPPLQHYEPVPGAEYSPTAGNEQFQYSEAPQPGYSNVDPRTLDLADQYVQRGLSNDTGFGVDPSVEWAIKNQRNQFNEASARTNGPAWENSTVGQQGMAFRDAAEAQQRFAARQAALTTGVGVQANLRGQAAQRTGLQLQANQQNVQQREQQATMNQQNNQFRTASDAQQAQYNAQLRAQQAMFGTGLDVSQGQFNQGFEAQQKQANAALAASQRNTDTAGRFGINMQGNQLQQGNQQYAANSIASGMAGAGGLLGTIGTLGFMMSDAREKDDIIPMFKHKGVHFYSYTEKRDPEKRMRIGPLAQEVAQKRPDAVREDEEGVLHIGAKALRHMLS